MRVLQVGKYYYPYMGGIETHLSVLCNELKPHVDFDVLVCNTKRETKRESVQGIPVTRCLEVSQVASTSLCPTMPLELSRRQYDLIHFHFPHPMGVVSYLASRRPARHGVVITYHSDIVRQRRLLRLYAPFMTRVMNRADAIICTSPNYLESSTELQRHRDKCTVIPYGIDVEQFRMTPEIEAAAAAIRQKYPGRPILLGVGRLIYYKGFEYAVRAMRSLDATLLLAGDGPLQRELESLARACGVADKVVFLGEIHNDALAPYYHAADLFVFPSVARSEAFGIVQLEAMACGVPVVNTDLASGVPFASRHDESGLTVEPRNAEAFAAAIGALLANPSRRAAFGEAARQRVAREFTKEVMAAQTLALYRRVHERVRSVAARSSSSADQPAVTAL